MAARWVGLNSVLCGCVRSLQRRFPIVDVLLLSGDIRDQVAKLFQTRAEILIFLGGRQISGGPPKFPTEFYKSGSQSNMLQSLVTIG